MSGNRPLLVVLNNAGEKGMSFINRLAALTAVATLALPSCLLAADMRGVTATEIRIGQTMPYSGPVSAFGALGKGELGYFKMINERGGINGRKVNLISLDDGYAPPKTVKGVGIRRPAICDAGSLACTSLNAMSRPPAR
jgi:ABC-type branched-subunit amino acid transport system substrate-binding protein